MKRILSLVLAAAVAFTMLVMPVSAAEVPTATIVASIEGDAPVAGKVFLVTMSIKNVSTSSLTSGQINWNWPGEVASLVDIMDLENPYVLSEADVKAGYHLGNQLNPFEGRTGKFSFAPGQAPNLTTGYAAAGIFIDNGARDKSPEALTEETTKLFDVAYVINDGYTVEDFYIELLDTTTFILDPNDDTIASSAADGAITLESIKPAAPAIEYTDANGITYKADSDNLISVNGLEGLTNAADGGATTWAAVPANTVNPDAAEDAVYVHATTIKGGQDVNTMRTFFPIEGGKTYYVTHTLYNNTGAATVSHENAGMSAIIATGNPVYGTHAGLTMYSHVDFGGFSSWSAANDHKDAIYVGAEAPRNDYSVPAGYNKVEALIKAPAEATNIMISYCAWGSVDLYYGDWAIYEMKATEEIVDMVIEYKDVDGNVVATETKTGAVGKTVDVLANTVVAGTDGSNYMVVDNATFTYVSGGSTEPVVVDKVQTVTISYTVGGVEVATGTVEGVNGKEAAYNSGNIATATGVYAKAGTITVDAANLTAVVELDVVAEGLVSAAGQSADAVNTLEKQMTTAGTVTFDLTVLNIKDTLVALDNAAVIAASGNYFADSSAYIQLKDGNFTFNDGSGVQTLAAYELGKTYSVEFVLDVANYTYTVTIMDGETEVAKAENVGMRNDVAPIDSLVILDNAGAGAGAVVVSVPVVETDDEQPTEEPTQAPSEDEDEPTQAPSEDEDEPTQAPSEDEDEPTQAPSEDEDEPTQAPSEDEDEPTQAPSEDEDEPTQAPTEDEDEPTQAPSEDEDEPTQAPSEDEEEPTDEPSDEPSEEPVEDLPYEAVDVVITPSALGVNVSGKFVITDEDYVATEKVVVVYSYLKDGKAFSVQALEVSVENGEVELPVASVSAADGEVTLAGISLLTGIEALDAIVIKEGNLGTPVGRYIPE